MVKLNKDNFSIFYFYNSNAKFFIKAVTAHTFFKRCHKNMKINFFKTSAGLHGMYFYVQDTIIGSSYRRSSVV